VNLADTWLELEAVPGDSGRAVTRIHPDSPFDLHVGLDLSSRTRELLFRRRWRQTDELPEFPVTQAVRCIARFEPGGLYVTLVVELVDVDLGDIFTPVVEDLARRIVSSEDELAATNELADGIARWQELFEKLSQEGLGRLVRRGLAGELIILQQEVIPLLPVDAALAAWTGPTKANQDFQRPAVALEVKATTAKQPQELIVANERELDTTGVGLLALVHVSLDERRGGTGQSLNAIVESLKERLTGHPIALADLTGKLANLGYVGGHTAIYDEPRYQVRELRYFHVREGFPRLTEVDLPDGVGDVRYTVALAACQPFIIDAAAVHRLITDDGRGT
jgi:hypothetical protein